jgi:hypothetical protein
MVINKANNGPNQIRIPNITSSEKQISNVLFNMAFNGVCKGIFRRDKMGR